MKKLVTLLLTAALAITAATTAFADTTISPDANDPLAPSNKGIPVTYTVNPSYTVTIPTSVTLDSNTKSSTAKVKAENVTVPYGQSVKVALATDFKVTSDEGAELTYTVKKDNVAVANNAVVLEVASNATGKTGETALTFELNDNIVYSGTYTDTVTFTVSVGTKTT